GLVVELREGGPGVDYVAEVVGKRAHYATGTPSLLIDRQQGKPVVVVSVIFQHAPDILAVAKSSGIISPQQLVNKKIMVKQNNQTPAVLAMLLNETGSLAHFDFLDQTNDLDGLMAGKFAAIAVYSTEQPYYFQQHNFPITELKPINYGIDFYGDNLFTSAQEIAGHPERAQAFLRASLKGWAYAMAHPDEAIAVIKNIGSKHSSGHLHFEYQAMQNLLLPTLVPLGHSNEGRWRSIADTYVRLGLLKPDYSLSGFVYDPNPTVKVSTFYRYLYVAIALAAVLGFFIFALLAFNYHLQREIGRRKQMEAQLQLNEEKLSTLFQFSPTGMAYTDFASRKFIDVNPALQDMTGYTRDELLTMTYLDITAPEYRQQNLVQAELMGSTGRFGPFEKDYIRKDGNRVSVLVNGFILLDHTGRKVSWALVQDITASKKAQQELLLAKEAAEFASRAKSEFLTNISHELRTPLNAIIGFSQLLAMGELSPLIEEQKIAVGHIMTSGKHLLGLINEILDLARIESDRFELHLEPFALPPLLDETVSLMSPGAAERGIILTQGCHSEVAVYADFSRLRQVILNLLSNAIKYNREGGTVTLFCAVNGDVVRISVADTGLGIAAADQAALFQPFERLGAEKTGIEGTGIGLVVCKRLVEAMQGRIQFNSIEGVGSHFWIDLPIALGEKVPSGLPVQTNGLPLDPEHVSGRVIYIDDCVVNTNVMRHVFRKLPHVELLIGEHAESGLAQIRQYRPDLILMDINLPGMSGLDALHILKANPDTAAIPVVAVSAAAMPKVIEEGLQAGFMAYLTKPFDIPELIALVSKTLNKTGKAV
ncbi:MAG: ABC transporter substrate-binding protein, partial [Methylovulum sp.]|nr:ABC transporter substrate-binding protein [Methylovulum sp.]